MKEEMNVLKHYTNVDALFKILSDGFLFSDGQKWEDKNDSFDIQQYAIYLNKHVLVLCFCDGDGNIYHWNSLGWKDKKNKNSNIKCSIVLNKEEMLQYIRTLGSDYEHHNVIYCHNADVSMKNVSEVPYLKRMEFAVEKEYRIVYKGTHSNVLLPCIQRYVTKIVIGRCESSDFDMIRNKLNSDYGIPLDIIRQNKLLDSQEWRNNIQKLFV